MKRFPDIPIPLCYLKHSGMTKKLICAKDCLEIVGFSRNFKESRTNLNVSKQFKKFSDSKKTSTFGVLFAKVMDMT